MYKFKDEQDVEYRTGDVTHKQGIGIQVLYYVFTNATGTRWTKTKIAASRDPNYQNYIGAMVKCSDGEYRFIKLGRCPVKLGMHMDHQAVMLKDKEKRPWKYTK